MVQKTKEKILDILTRGPNYGYALMKELRVSISTIYAHLEDLEERGLVEVWKTEEKRKFYRITERGRLYLSVLK